MEATAAGTGSLFDPWVQAAPGPARLHRRAVIVLLDGRRANPHYLDTHGKRCDKISRGSRHRRTPSRSTRSCSNAEKLDTHFSGDGERLRVLYTSVLQQYELLGSEPLSNMVTSLVSLDVPWDQAAAERFANAWPTAGPSRTNADPILRHGYAEAFLLALRREPPVPVETFWVTGAGDDFEVHVSDGTDHVTVFMIVPGTPRRRHPRARRTPRTRAGWSPRAAGPTTRVAGTPQPLAGGDVMKIEVSGRADPLS